MTNTSPAALRELAKANARNKRTIAARRRTFAYQTANLNRIRHSGNLNKPYKYG